MRKLIRPLYFIQMRKIYFFLGAAFAFLGDFLAAGFFAGLAAFGFLAAAFFAGLAAFAFFGLLGFFAAAFFFGDLAFFSPVTRRRKLGWFLQIGIEIGIPYLN